MNNGEMIKFMEDSIKRQVEFLNKLTGKKEPIYGFLNIEEAKKEVREFNMGSERTICFGKETKGRSIDPTSW